MSPAVRELFRYVCIGLGFGFVWAAIEYANGQMRDINLLSGYILLFGIAGVLMWVVRRVFLALRDRK